MKKIIKEKLAVFLINLLSKTWQISVEGEPPKSPSVVAFWHGEMMPIWKFFSASEIKTNAIVSLSKDGELLAKVLEKWDFSLIRGSSSRNSKEALSEAVNRAKESLLMITPDGPRGPARQFKNGAAIIAFRANVPLIAVRTICSKAKIFEKSWDKFQLPLPFAKVKLEFSEQITIPANFTNEEVSIRIKEIELLMNKSV